MVATIDHLERTKSIGSSDAPAVCGVDPYRSAVDVWLEKTGRAAPFNGNDATEAGQRLEDAVIGWAFDQLDVLGSRQDVSLVHPEREYMTANLDATAILSRGPVIVEAKTAGICSPLAYDAWGEEGTDRIPERHLVQIHHQFAVAGPEYQEAYLAALLPPRGFCLFHIRRNEDIIQALIEREESFWLGNVKPLIEPEGQASTEVLKRVRRKIGKEVILDDSEAALHLAAARESAKSWKKVVESAERDLLNLLGDAEIGVYPGGQVTYFETKRKGYEVQETTYRTLRVVPAKGGYIV